MELPKAKTENIVMQNLNDEVLIYNLTTNQAFCLNETSAKVFNACDGATTLAELKAESELTDDIIYLALDELKKNDLLDESTDFVSPFAGLSRREVIKKVGLASMIALPVISGLVAPTALMAASGDNAANCVPLNQCRPANTNVCPAGCTGTYSFVGYTATSNGTCGGAGSPQEINCAASQGALARVDFKRTS